MKQGKVLVLGDDTRSFLAVVRSLGRQSIEVHAAPIDFTSPALASRYIRRIHYLPFWTAGAEAWLNAMDALLRAERFDLVIPCNELTLLPLQQHRERFAALARLAIPDERALAALFDKQATRELAVSVGGHVAPGGPALPGDDPAAVFARYGAPVVLKPRRSYAIDGLEVRGRVRVCDTPAMLGELLPTIQPDEFFYEGFLAGQGAGVSVLASRGRILQAFEHHRVRENESGSYYRVSAPLTPALEACCSAMAAALGYTGIAMFEFRLGADMGERPDDWVLLEVNARPWGSLPLPVSLGVDFPYRWYQLLVDGVETPAVAYEAGLYGRNLVLDVRNTLSELKATRTGLAPLAAGRVAELGRILTGRERYDALVRDDMGPGWRELRDTGAQAGERLAQSARVSRLPGLADVVRARGRGALRRAVRARDAGRVTLLFVCQGNICRSPFAAGLMRQLGAGHSRLQVASAGMLPRPGRPTPPFGIEAAAAHGVDLAPHRSAHLSREDAEGATAILIFDDVNRVAIRRRYPGLAVPVLKLGAFGPRRGGDDIADPIDRGLAFYAATYDRIAAAVAGLMTAVADDMGG